MKPFSFRALAALRVVFVTAAAVPALSAPLFLTPCPAYADSAAIAPVSPAATKVLILPTLDTTADRPEMQQEHIITSDHRLAYEFVIRGFAVQAPDVAQRAARVADIDLTAPDERTRKNLKVLGKAAGANWVVALTIADVSEKKTGNFLSGGGRRAQAKVEIRIWDVDADNYITNKFYEDTKSTKRLFNSIGTTGLFRQAVDTTVQRSVQDILVPYPIIKHMREQFDENDVVTGESASGLASGTVPAGVPTLAAGTSITVVLQSMLRSDVARDGDPITFHVRDDVYSTDGSHKLFIPKNALAMGRVIVAKERGYAGKPGTLQFSCDYATSAAGKRVYLRGSNVRATGRSNQTSALVVAGLVSSAGLLVNGRDAKFDAGTPFVLFVDQDTALTTSSTDTPATMAAAPIPAASSAAPAVPQTLFTMTDGSQTVGRLVSFDGSHYVVATLAGSVSLDAATVRSMNALAPPAASSPAPAPQTSLLAVSPASAPPSAAPAPTPLPAVPAAPLAPRLPAIAAFPQHVRLETQDGNSYFGDVTAFDGTLYTVKTSSGILSVRQADIKALELLKPN